VDSHVREDSKVAGEVPGWGWLGIAAGDPYQMRFPGLTGANEVMNTPETRVKPAIEPHLEAHTGPLNGFQ
jgi:hypothetical protein